MSSSKTCKTGIIVPTRGLVFTETIIGLLEGFAGREYQIYLSHNLPTPDSFNTLIKQALDDGNDYILITNDDVVITKEIVDKLFEKCSDIVFCPCYIGDFPGYYMRGKDTPQMIGTSCVLLTRKAMEDIGELRTDTMFGRVGDKEIEIKKPKQFGGEEVWLSRQAIKLGYELVKIDDRARHLQLIEMGEHYSNHGLHKIGEK